MSWLDRLTKADLDGFEFLTENHDAKSGKRLVIHEFPHSDEVEVERFGAKAKAFKLNAYFIGADYDLEVNGFTEKLAATGAVWLNHPWLGQLWVEAADWTRSESNDKGGYGVVSIDFVPGGRAPYEPTVDKVDVAIDRVRQLQTAVIDDFDLQPMSADAMTAFIADVQQHLDGIRQAISLATLPLTWANQVANVIQGVKNDVGVLMQVPQQYANALGSFANTLGFGADNIDDNVPSATRARAVARITTTAISPAAITASNTAATVSAPYKLNKTAEGALRSRLLVVSAAQIALADYDDAATRDGVLNGLLKALDTLMPTMSDEVFQAASDARMALIEALLDQDLGQQISRDIYNAMPSTLLAYQMGIDEDVFIAKNSVSHPLFVVGRVYG
ncbi:MAG: DNA circularization N-terminal domain-containing protein [Methylotenera sp.]|nr:DNA circularization N-terminal domain-containing protein [Methylotenera sp.]